MSYSTQPPVLLTENEHNDVLMDRTRLNRVNMREICIIAAISAAPRSSVACDVSEEIVPRDRLI